MEHNHIESEWTAKGFIDRFEQIMSQHKTDDGFTYMRGYLQAEEEHTNLFNHPRFRSYESFREYRRQIIFKK